MAKRVKRQAKSRNFITKLGADHFPWQKITGSGIGMVEVERPEGKIHFYDIF